MSDWEKQGNSCYIVSINAIQGFKIKLWILFMVTKLFIEVIQGY